MNDFIRNIVARHAGPCNSIRPRARGMFEPVNAAATPYADSNFNDAPTSGEAQPYLQNMHLFDKEPGGAPKAQDGVFEYKTPGATSLKSGTLFQKTPAAESNGSNNKQESNASGQNTGITHEITVHSINTNAPFNKDLNFIERKAVLKNASANKESFIGSGAEKKENFNPGLAPDNSGLFSEPSIKPLQRQRETSFGASGNQRNGLLQQPAPLPKNIKRVQGQNAYHSRPVVKVTIGRIEIKAVVQTTTPPKTNGPAKPKMSLEDYLKGRNNAAS
jgi:hypothetical protein